MDKRYVLCPGYVISKSDGDRHYITAHQLARLYGVNIQKCVVREPNNQASFGYRKQPNDIYLRPRMDGNYKLPVTTKSITTGESDD